MLTVVLSLIFLICGILAWRQIKANKDEPPAYSGSLPLIGLAHILNGDNTKLLTSIKGWSYECLQNGGAMYFSIGPKVFYTVTDPEEILNISNICLQKDNVYKFTKPWLGDGLGTSEASVWKVHRKLLNPAFNTVILDGYLDVFNEQARRLVKDLEDEVGKGPFDHSLYIRNNSLETILLAVMGVDIRDKTEQYAEYADALEDINNIFVERFQNLLFHSDLIYSWSALKRKQDKCVKILVDMSNSILKRSKAAYLNSRNKEVETTTKDSKFKPFLELILKLAIEKDVFNDQQIREHLDTMIFGGCDPLATVVMYTMLLVGTYPHVQEKIFEELHNVFGNDDRDVMKQDLKQLVYLDAVLKESHRIYPVAPVVARHLDRDIKLRNCTLSKGRTCFLSIYGVHRHPMWGPDVEEFKPERWLDPATLPKFPNALASFSMGKRNCYGQAYATTFMKTALAHIFRNYKVTGDHTQVVAQMSLLMRPVSGHHIRIEKRNKQI